MPERSPFTAIAIQTYQQVVRAELRLEKCEKNLSHWVAKVPDEDMPYYIEQTEEIELDAERKRRNYGLA